MRELKNQHPRTGAFRRTVGKLVLIALATSSVSARAQQDEGGNSLFAGEKPAWLTFGWLSRHMKNNDKRNNENVGLGLEKNVAEDWSVAAGFYENSFYRTSYYAGLNWQGWTSGNWRAGVMTGVVNGYQKLNNGGVYPFLFPMLQYEGRELGANLALVPPYAGKTEGFVSLQLKFRF